MERSDHGGGFFHSQEELLAAIEGDLGAERAEAVRRSLAWQPRQLTDAERAELRANLEPVLRDMRVSGAIVPDVVERAHEDAGPGVVCALIQHPEHAGGWSIQVKLGEPPADRLAGLADQLQEWEVEELAAAGRPATWPECPGHPDSHPLSPEARDGEAAWCCPVSGQVVCSIGTLRAGG